MKAKILLLMILTALLASGGAFAGTYSGPTDTTHSIDPAISKSDSSILGWATGWEDYLPAPDVDSQWRTPENAINNTPGIVTLGDLDQAQIEGGVNPGEITLTFDNAITNGARFDFAVFENGFVSPSDPYLFAELAYVEVSTDGTNFARFDSITENDYGWQGAYGRAFGGYDSTGFCNLAGKHANNYGNNYGTQFDLDDLTDHALVLADLVDLNKINYVKIIDIPGIGAVDADGNPLGSPHPYFTDSEGNPIYDNWLTRGSGGFDLDEIGVLNQVPIPGALWLLGSGLLGLIGIRRKRASSQ